MKIIHIFLTFAKFDASYHFLFDECFIQLAQYWNFLFFSNFRKSKISSIFHFFFSFMITKIDNNWIYFDNKSFEFILTTNRSNFFEATTRKNCCVFSLILKIWISHCYFWRREFWTILSICHLIFLMIELFSSFSSTIKRYFSFDKVRFFFDFYLHIFFWLNRIWTNWSSTNIQIFFICWWIFFVFYFWRLMSIDHAKHFRTAFSHLFFIDIR